MVFTTEVPLRWSDQDLNRHVNHARIVTLFEEARIPWLFNPGLPTAGLGNGAVMTEMTVRYRGQILHEPGPVVVRMWISQVRAAWFVVHHEMRNHNTAADAPAEVTMECTIAAFDLASQRPRRLSRTERDYLRRFIPDTDTPDSSAGLEAALS